MVHARSIVHLRRCRTFFEASLNHVGPTPTSGAIVHFVHAGSGEPLFEGESPTLHLNTLEKLFAKLKVHAYPEVTWVFPSVHSHQGSTLAAGFFGRRL